MSESDVSDKELLIDIDSTRKEIEAYELMARGEDILAHLPENAGDRFHRNKVIVLTANIRDCREFLEKLLALKSKRGL